MLTRETELSILYEIASISNRLSTVDELLAVGLDKAIRLLGTEVALIYMHEPSQRCLRVRAARGIRINRVLAELPLPDEASGFSTQPLAWVANQRSPFPGDPLLGSYPVQAALGLPIRSGAELFGWLYVARLKPLPFEDNELALFSVLGDRLATALEIIVARERDRQQQQTLAEANQQLEQMLRELMEAHHRQEQLLQTIRDLSTPILSVADGILLMPLIGSIDSGRSKQMMETLLEAVSRKQTQVVILDVTGVPMIDTQVANVLLQTARAAGLLGAEVILCGITPEVAQVIISLGLDLRVMRSTADLQEAIRLAFRKRAWAILSTGAAGGRAGPG